MVVEVAVLHIKRDPVGRDLWWTFRLLVDQLFAVHGELHVFLWLGGLVAIEQPACFTGRQVNNDDRAFAGVGDEGGVRARVDADIIQVSLGRRDIFTERDGVDDLVCREVDLYELRAAFDNLLHLQ